MPYNENSIVFSYIATQYSYPKDISYRYRLKGYDNSWILAGNKKEAVYTKLPPGKYTFEANATNTTGNWSNKIKTIDIIISPPWWKTWWASTLFIVIGICFIVWFINFKIKQATLKNSIELKLKEAKELQRLDKIKTRFFANMAHEFRTPLSLIQGPAEQLREDTTTDKNKLLDIIDKNTISLIQLTDQLLDIAKLEAGVLKPHMVWGDVIPVVLDIVNAFTEEAEAKQVAIRFEGPESAEFFFSINTIDRILYNLLSNALKYSNSGDIIKIKIIKEQNGLKLFVSDMGKGITEEEQHNIFKRYYRVLDNEDQKGSGIGLSLVKELVELHKGEINVESRVEAPSGTIFSVWLPLEQKSYIEDKIENFVPDSKDKPTILIVEDHAELSGFITGSLNQTYNVINAKNGKEGLTAAIQNIPDIIISDVNMSEMNGLEFCKAIRTDINTSHIPVILLTAKADNESRLEGLSMGASDYVTKPFSIAELRLRVGNQIKLQKQLSNYFHSRQVDKSTNVTDEYSEERLVHEEFLNRIHLIIEDNLDDKNFSVDELAGALYMSRTSLHRKVKAMFDLPASEIIKVYRLKKAAEMLKKNYTVSEVAYMTGFNTPSYFSKCFKEYFGDTPAKHGLK